MNLSKTIPIIIIIAVVCSGIIFYLYNSRLSDLQSVIDEQQTEISTLQTQVAGLENQLHTNFSIQSYVNWIAIPRNESRMIPLILQSQYENEDNCTLTLKNEIDGVICSLNVSTLPLSSESLRYVALTIEVMDSAMVDSYSLLIEAAINETIRIEIVNITVL